MAKKTRLVWDKAEVWANIGIVVLIVAGQAWVLTIIMEKVPG